MAYWLAMVGAARPRERRLRHDWHPPLAPRELVRFETGDAGDDCPIGPGDMALIGASGWSRLVAAVEVVRAPELGPAAGSDPRKRWVLYGRPMAALTNVATAPRIAAAGVPTSHGEACVPIGRAEFEAGLRALREPEAG